MSKTNQANIPNTTTQNSAEIDRATHDSGSFFYKYRWWIVLVLAILLGYFLYSKRHDLGITTTNNLPRLTNSELNIAEAPTNMFDTEGRKLLGM